MKRILVVALILLAVFVLFACNKTVDSLQAKYDETVLPLGDSVNVSSFFDITGKGTPAYSIEDSSVLKLEKGVVTAIKNGESLITATFETLSASVRVKVADTRKVTVEATDVTVPYDGTLKNITVSGNLPEGSSVSYTVDGGAFNGTSEIGSYLVKITVSVPQGRYVEYLSDTATLTVTKATVNISGISFNGGTYVYDGGEKVLLINGTLPSGVSVSYVNNKHTDAGFYDAVAHFTVADTVHYEEIPSLSARLTISRKTFNISETGFDNRTYTYNGTSHNISIADVFPSGLSVKYFYNGSELTGGFINSGTYLITAKFTVEPNSEFAKNYVQLSDTSVLLNIAKARFTDPVWKSGNRVYNGGAFTVGTGGGFDFGLAEKPVGVNGEFPEGASVSYNYDSFTNAGVYRLTATFTMPSGYSNNYYTLSQSDYTVTIERAIYDTSGILFAPVDTEGKDFSAPTEFDGKWHTFTVTDGSYNIAEVSIIYYVKTGTSALTVAGNTAYGAGTYEIEARLTLLLSDAANYQALPSKRITVVVKKKITDISAVAFSSGTFVYNGSEQGIVLLNVPEELTVNYSESGVITNKKINAGVYMARATLIPPSLGNYTLLYNGAEKTVFTSTFIISKTVYTESDIGTANFSATGGEYDPDKRLSSYPIAGGSFVSWVFPNTIPTVDVTSYKAKYNADAANYEDFDFDIQLIITQRVVAVDTLQVENQFLPLSQNVKPSISGASVPQSVLKLQYLFAPNFASLGKVDISGAEIALSDTVNYRLDKQKTFPSFWVHLYDSALYTYSGTRLTSYKSSISTVNVLDGTTAISSNAFSGRQVQSLYIPDSVTELGSYAFAEIENLVFLNIPFVGQTGGNSEIFGAPFGRIGSSVSNTLIPTSLSSVIIRTQTIINPNAFKDAKYLQRIEYLSDLTAIGDSAFSGCNALNTLLIPGGFTAGANAFRGCFNLTELAVPFIGSSKSSMQPITYLIGTNSGENAFSKYVWNTLRLLDASVTAFPSYAFQGLSAVKEIIFPETVSAIGAYAFSGVTATITLNSNFSIITEGLFSGYAGTSLILPEFVTEIGAYAFSNAVSLSVLNLPAGLLTIRARAFSGMTGEVVFAQGATITEIGAEAFRGYASGRLTIPQSVITVGSSAFRDSYLTSIIIPNTVQSIGISVFENCTRLSRAEIYIENIPDYSFRVCTNLDTVILASGLKTIGSSAFYGCSRLQGINIPESVTHINGGAFWNCNSLQMITIRAATPPIMKSDTFSSSPLQTILMFVPSASLDSYKKYFDSLDYWNINFSAIAG